jgi:hypothetical protein
MEQNLLDNREYFMYLASNMIVQRWLREVDFEELVAACLSMDKDLLKVIKKNLSPSGQDNLMKRLSQVSENNNQSLTDSFYKKLLKVLVACSPCPDLSIPYNVITEKTENL